MSTHLFAYMLTLALALITSAGTTTIPLPPQRMPARPSPGGSSAVFIPIVLKFGFTLAPATGPGRSLRAAVAPAGGDDFAQASFSIWFPVDVPVLRGVLVYAPGCGASSLTDEPGKERAALARKWHLAYLGMQFVDKADGKTCGWSNTGSGSPEALQRALQSFAQQAARPELAHAPWLLFGVSGGSGWAVGLAELYPERIYAVYSRGFGSSNEDLSDPALLVPVLLNGKKDGSYGTIPAFQRCRGQGALCALNVDPGSEPRLGDQWAMMALPFFDAVLQQRMPPDTPVSGPVSLLPMEQARAWLGNPTTFAVAAHAAYGGDPLTAVWLPDEPFAHRWRNYNANGVLSAWTP